jgi:hypothetical protein
MGNWGHGVFENDSARDYLDVLLFKLIEDIELGFLIRTTMSAVDFLEESGEYKFIPAIDILVTLNEKYNSFPVNRDMALQWRHDYMQTYDTAAAEDPSYFPSQGLQVLIALFDRLDADVARRNSLS